MDMYTTGFLNRVVRQLDPDPAAYFINTFFRTEQAEESEEIHFDVTDEEPRISPFVSPLREGRLVEHEGYTTNTFKPAYIKDKRVFNAQAPIKRVPGEPILGSYSAAERTRILLGQALRNQNTMLTRREEVMASEVLRTGKSTISGEGFETVVVDFLRAAALTIAPLTGNARWSETATAAPLANLETWSGLILTNGGGVARDVIMDPVVWSWMRQNTDVENLMDTRRGSQSAGELGPLATQYSARNVATIGDFNIWLYQDPYIDEDGAAGLMMPSGTVLLVNGANLEGVRHYGMVQDFDAAHQAQRAFSKSWTIEDPSQRILLMQSAPLVVPYRPNCTLGAEVLNGGA